MADWNMGTLEKPWKQPFSDTVPSDWKGKFDQKIELPKTGKKGESEE